MNELFYLTWYDYFTVMFYSKYKLKWIFNFLYPQNFLFNKKFLVSFIDNKDNITYDLGRIYMDNLYFHNDYYNLIMPNWISYIKEHTFKYYLYYSYYFNTDDLTLFTKFKRFNKKLNAICKLYYLQYNANYMLP